LRGVFFGILFSVIVLVAGVPLYLKFGRPPVAVADAPFPFEKQLVRTAVRSRIAREMSSAPISASPEVFEAGAHIYRERCSVCHGIPGHDSPLAKAVFPAPPQLWKKHGQHGAVGVSEDDLGFSYWIVSNGLRLTAMPSFKNLLSDTQRWQVSLLLKNADHEMPATVTQILNEPEPSATK
jgi:mono/diheme cytochrome c family protein